MNTKSLGMLVFFTSVLGSGAVWAQPLNLSEYQQQVESCNPGLQAARSAAEGAGRLVQERRLLTSPYAFAEGSRADDRSESLEPMYYGDSREQSRLTIGVEEETLAGLRWRLFHQTEYDAVNHADPMLMPFSSYYTCRTGVELVQDLWRNAFGQNLRSMTEALEARYQSETWTRRYQEQQIRVQAEKLYVQVAVAQAVVKIQGDLLARAGNLADWVKSRVRLKLQDESDLIQAQSQVEARRLEVAGAQDQFRQAARAFNLLRARNTDEIPETLALPEVGTLVLPGLPEAAPVRLDIRAQEFAARAAACDSARKRDDLSPEVQASAAVYLNGLDQDWSPAFSEAGQWNGRTWAVGLNLRVPLDWFTRLDLSEGYDFTTRSAEAMLAQQRLEAEAQWFELRRRLPEYRERWEIARNLETLQQRKAENERRRLQRGNSLMYQVLQFEQDWGQSQLARLQIEAVLLDLLAEVKLFEAVLP